MLQVGEERTVHDGKTGYYNARILAERGEGEGKQVTVHYKPQSTSLTHTNQIEKRPQPRERNRNLTQLPPGRSRPPGTDRHVCQLTALAVDTVA